MVIPIPRIRIPLYAQTLIALVLGAVVGIVFGRDAMKLGVIAKVIITIIQNAAIPLIFLAVWDAVINTEFRGRSVVSLFGISLLNASCAVTIGLILTNVFHPGTYLHLTISSELPKGGIAAAFESQHLTSREAIVLFLASPMVVAILSALALGALFLGINKFSPLGTTAEEVREKSRRGLALLMKIVIAILHLVPLAVFSSVAKVTGEHGFVIFQGLGAYFVLCLAGMFLHVALVYHTWIVGIAKIGFRRFWREAREPVAHAFGINSSLATLPFTLKALERLGVSPSSARLSACVGTNFNNDGILLYEMVAVIFMAQAYGLHPSLSQQLTMALICVIATVGVGGIPEAGIISLAIVLAAARLPAEGVTLLLTVDWLIARCRSVTNVLGDMTVAIGIDAVEGRRPSQI